MKPNPLMLFGNFLNDKNITPERLLTFCGQLKQNLVLANDKNQFDAVIALLTSTIKALSGMISDIDSGLSMQVGATGTVDAMIAAFSAYMSDNEPFIAKALGGATTPAFIEFYPHKISEYSDATKGEMDMLTTRVKKAAEKYAAKLGAELSTDLQGFEPQWEALRGDQEKQKGSVKDSRTDRGTGLEDLQLAVLTAIHTVALAYIADVDKCVSFFPFHLLYAVTKHKHSITQGNLVPLQLKVVLNQMLTDTVTITFRNPGTNSSYLVWLSPTADGKAPADAYEIKPGDSLEIKPSKLGNLSYTFLLVQNTSAVNDGQYEIEFVGLKSNPFGEDDTEEEVDAAK